MTIEMTDSMGLKDSCFFCRMIFDDQLSYLTLICIITGSRLFSIESFYLGPLRNIRIATQKEDISPMAGSAVLYSLSSLMTASRMPCWCLPISVVCTFSLKGYSLMA